MAGCGLSRHEAGRIYPHPSTTDIRGYDLGDQEVIDIQASQGVSVSIVDGRREEVGKLFISQSVALTKLIRLKSTHAPGP